jgi:hypothetical protein
MKFIEFRDVYGNRVFINSEQVTYIQHYTDDQTHVHFGHEHKAMIEAPVDQVVNALSS